MKESRSSCVTCQYANSRDNSCQSAYGGKITICLCTREVKSTREICKELLKRELESLELERNHIGIISHWKQLEQAVGRWHHKNLMVAL